MAAVDKEGAEEEERIALRAVLARNAMLV